jgi:hypothetical protein
MRYKQAMSGATVSTGTNEHEMTNSHAAVVLTARPPPVPAAPAAAPAVAAAVGVAALLLALLLLAEATRGPKGPGWSANGVPAPEESPTGPIIAATAAAEAAAAVGGAKDEESLV